MTILDDSYPESNANTKSWVCSTYSMVGQSFTSGGGISDSVKFWLRKYGSPTGNATARIYAHSGTYGTDSIPTGSILAESETFDVATLTTTYQLITFNFTGAERITLTAGYYVVVLSYSGGDCTNDRVENGQDDTSPTHDGNFSYYDTAWHSEAKDGIFYVYVESPVSIIMQNMNQFNGGMVC